jgi:hypothetical protein
MSSGAIISTGLRGGVERLLRGEVREQDIRDLFFSMREETGGSGLVSEVAHFMAHPMLRTQGMIVRELRDSFAFLRVRQALEYRRVLSNSMPPNFAEAMKANLRRMRKNVLRKKTG